MSGRALIQRKELNSCRSSENIPPFHALIVSTCNYFMHLPHCEQKLGFLLLRAATYRGFELAEGYRGAVEQIGRKPALVLVAVPDCCAWERGQKAIRVEMSQETAPSRVDILPLFYDNLMRCQNPSYQHSLWDRVSLQGDQT